MKKLSIRSMESIAGLVVDVVALIVVAWLSLSLLMVDVRMSALWALDYYFYLIYAIPALIFSYLACGIYTQIWAFARVSGLIRLMCANVLFTAVVFLLGAAIGTVFPISFYIVNCFLIATVSWSFRNRKTIGERLSFYFHKIFLGRKEKKSAVKMLVVGAGEAASILVQEFQSERGKEVEVVGMVDDNPLLIGMTMHGVKVLGICEDIPALYQMYGVSEIVVAIPSANEAEMTRVLKLCQSTQGRVQVMPHISDSVNFRLRDLRTPDICDFVGREEFSMNRNALYKLVFGKTILVTGGGGSIGSELCRQIMQHNPRKLILLDQYENSMYDLYSELLEKYGEDVKKRIALHIGSVCDGERVEKLFVEYSPQLVFHAAAYKHVPLMEDCPEQAIKNNVFGTYTVAKTALKHNVDKFLLISTDKAVNPTNVMGASKHAAELVVLAMQQRSTHTGFVAVRFGNVLGSNGSAVVQFKRQIEHGGPVRITHPEIIRYFMTINEAVSLVLEAMFLAKSGELFVLDMGSPVKIKDLAYKMIEMAGLRPEEDIKIEYTGLRPGEKLFEELLLDAEKSTKTQNKKIFIAHPRTVSAQVVEEMLEAFRKCLQQGDDVKRVLLKYIPGYKTKSVVAPAAAEGEATVVGHMDAPLGSIQIVQ